jgi:hypothetical protein
MVLRSPKIRNSATSSYGRRPSLHPWLLPTLAVCLVATALVLALLRARGEESLESAMRRCFAAAQRGDIRTLLRYMPQEELERLGWTKRELHAFVEWSRGAWADMKLAGPPHFEISHMSGVGYGEWFMRGSDDRETSLQLSAFRSDTGPKVFLSLDLLLAAAQAKYGHRYPQATRAERSYRALHQCLSAESPSLRAMGLKGVVNTSPEFPLQTWSALETFAEQGASRVAAAGVAEESP